MFCLLHLPRSTVGSGVSTAVKCADVSECCVGEERYDMLLRHHYVIGVFVVSVGGCVQSLAWDRNGERLAVLFARE